MVTYKKCCCSWEEDCRGFTNNFKSISNQYPYMYDSLILIISIHFLIFFTDMTANNCIFYVGMDSSNYQSFPKIQREKKLRL